ncbi:MAG: hypothetical protein ACE5LU_00215 [Anaerolineae bacterium]
MPVNPTHLLLVVVGATSLVALSRTWQIALLALLVHYLALGGLVLELGPLARGGLRILIGGLVCLVLFLTTKRVEHAQRAPGSPVVDRRQISEVGFRLAAVGLAVIGVFGASIPARFPSLPAELVLASAWLMAIGLVTLLISRELLWVGMGLLTVESGFETIYTALDPRLELAGLLAAGALMLAFVVAAAVTFVDRGRKTP